MYRSDGRKSVGSQLLVLLAILVLAIGLAAAVPTSAEALACGSVTAGGSTYIVGGGGVTCAFQRRWVRQMVAYRNTPSGWRCTIRSTSGGCSKGSGRSKRFFIYYPPD
jgi:hypothetical protein